MTVDQQIDALQRAFRALLRAIDDAGTSARFRKAIRAEAMWADYAGHPEGDATRRLAAILGAAPQMVAAPHHLAPPSGDGG